MNIEKRTNAPETERKSAKTRVYRSSFMIDPDDPYLRNETLLKHICACLVKGTRQILENGLLIEAIRITEVLLTKDKE